MELYYADKSVVELCRDLIDYPLSQRYLDTRLPEKVSQRGRTACIHDIAYEMGSFLHGFRLGKWFFVATFKESQLWRFVHRDKPGFFYSYRSNTPFMVSKERETALQAALLSLSGSMSDVACRVDDSELTYIDRGEICIAGVFAEFFFKESLITPALHQRHVSLVDFTEFDSVADFESYMERFGYSFSSHGKGAA